MSDRLPLLRILLISHTVDAILPPMESNRQRDSVSMGKDTKKGFLERRPPGSPEREHKKGASREPKARPGGPIRVKRRRATLPHPLECSTIAAPGLSYRVRNGTGRLTRAMTTANLTATARKPKESKPACHRWRFGNRLADAKQGLSLYRSVTIPTHIAVQDDPAQERRGTNPPQEDRNCCVAVAR